MSSPEINIPNAKQRGEWAELLFMARAAEQGLAIARPWGDSSPYDVAIEHNGSFLRIQVKSTSCQRGAAFKCHVDSNGVPYRWYIIPLAATHGQNEVLLAPTRPKSKYARYKEAWHLLRRKP